VASGSGGEGGREERARIKDTLKDGGGGFVEIFFFKQGGKR